jgi:hypothetical protein
MRTEAATGILFGLLAVVFTLKAIGAISQSREVARRAWIRTAIIFAALAVFLIMRGVTR